MMWFMQCFSGQSAEMKNERRSRNRRSGEQDPAIPANASKTLPRKGSYPYLERSLSDLHADAFPGPSAASETEENKISHKQVCFGSKTNLTADKLCVAESWVLNEGLSRKRRDAICEEIENEMPGKDGVSLKHFRKLLSTRQVLRMMLA